MEYCADLRKFWTSNCTEIRKSIMYLLRRRRGQYVDRDAVDTIMSLAYMRMHRYNTLGQFDPRKASIETYIWHVLRNSISAYYVHAARQVTPGSEDPDLLIDRKQVDPLLHVQIHNFFATTRPNHPTDQAEHVCNEVMIRRRRGMSTSDIAEDLGLSFSRVAHYVRLVRAAWQASG